MKCKVCGYTTRGKNALKNMAAHYRKKHPSKMKRKHKTMRSAKRYSKSEGAIIIIKGRPTEKQFDEIKRRVF